MNKDHFQEQITQLLIQWQDLKIVLTDLFENRQKSNALEPMKEGINIFMNFLFLSNEMPHSKGEESINECKWKPVNVVERIDFIKKRPNLYHSFIQLSELMSEQEKQFNKKNAIKKVAKQ